MSKDYPVLFQPFESEKLTLPNRIVMAPMTRSQSPNGVPGENVVAYYQRRAAADVGLIITEGTTVDYAAATGDANIPAFVGEKSLQAWKKVVEAVHAVGGKIAPQIWHQGMARAPGTGPAPDAPSLGPSGLAGDGKKVSEPMTIQQIEETIQAFANAGAQAKALGFDAVEIHAAHGYLIDQFFWEGTNKRSDKYGGDLVKRTQFAVEIVRAIRAAVGEEYPIILRFSQWKQQDYNAKLATTPDELRQFLSPLTDAGVDIFHASTRRFWEAEFEGSDLNLAGWTREISGKPTITVGSVGLDDDFLKAFQGRGAGVANIDALITQMERGDYELVAVGRALLSNPDWVTRVKAGHFDQLKPFSPEVLAELV